MEEIKISNVESVNSDSVIFLSDKIYQKYHELIHGLDISRDTPIKLIIINCNNYHLTNLGYHPTFRKLLHKNIKKIILDNNYNLENLLTSFTLNKVLINVIFFLRQSRYSLLNSFSSNLSYFSKSDLCVVVFSLFKSQ